MKFGKEDLACAGGRSNAGANWWGGWRRDLCRSGSLGGLGSGTGLLCGVGGGAVGGGIVGGGLAGGIWCWVGGGCWDCCEVYGHSASQNRRRNV